jgi:hypothetical protein
MPDSGLSRPAAGPARELRMLLEAQLIQIGYEEMSTVPVVAERVHQLRLIEPSLSGDTPGERALLAALTIHAMTGNASAARTARLADRAFSGGSQPSGATAGPVRVGVVQLLLCDRLVETAEWHQAMADAAIRSSSPRLHFCRRPRPARRYGTRCHNHSSSRRPRLMVNRLRPASSSEIAKPEEHPDAGS